MNKLIENAANLLKVKTIVTIVLTIVFAYQACIGKITNEFMNVYLVVIAFYFGTQTIKGKVSADYGIIVDDDN